MSSDERVWIVIGYFLLEKQTLNGLLMVIGIQIEFFYKYTKREIFAIFKAKQRNSIQEQE